ncbi:hypothetical protein BK004_02345 [bacterium CG10_46_32]|nr:MAG: hypothetical protein BK004_02345 [bacterium CG10_46_32]PIR56154.1 MAG: hypothetical protein COU73_02365 [Parcubacteria group bacterium CG10_big_fil_rev_8_21_14_0_10_46_32]
MADEYSGPLTVKLLEMGNSDIARIIAGLPDDAEIIATRMMDELVYRRKDYSRGIDICSRVFRSESLSSLRKAQLYIAMVNLARRMPLPDMEHIRQWLEEAWDVLAPMPLDTPAVRRSWVLMQYNMALVCRLRGDFEGEAENHKQVATIAEDEFSRSNALYMAHFAEMLRYTTEGTVTDVMWQAFKRAGDAYRDMLDPRNPRDAQWIANDWGHRVQLAILLDYIGEDEWITYGFDELVHLLSVGVPQSARYTADLIIAMTLFEYDNKAMVCWEAERIIADEVAGNECRMLAKLLAAHVICSVFPSSGAEKQDALRAVINMPGVGICHAVRAVAERMLATC